MAAETSKVMGGAQGAGETTKAKRKHTGAAKRKAQERVGSRGEWITIDQQTPAKSAAAQSSNARNAIAGGRVPRADAETNVSAFGSIKVVFVKNQAGLAARGAPMVALHGAQLN